jgi:hypothetical protein
MKKLLLLTLVTFTIGLGPAKAYDEITYHGDSFENMFCPYIDQTQSHLDQLDQQIATLHNEIESLNELYPTDEIDKLISDKKRELNYPKQLRGIIIIFQDLECQFWNSQVREVRELKKVEPIADSW